MYKKSITLLIVTVCLGVLSACNESKKTESKKTIGGNGEVDNPFLNTLDMDSITENNFFALVGFNFSSAVQTKYKLMPGTSFETPVKRLSFFFSKMQILESEQEAQNSGSYCELYTEISPKTNASSVRLIKGARLRLGAVTQSLTPQEVSFNLVLQQSVFEQFQLFCVNTKNVDEVNEHIGHILSITKDDASEIQPKIKSIGFFQDSFGVMFSKGSQSVMINATFLVKDLKKNSNNIENLFWRICDKNKGVCINEWQDLGSVLSSQSLVVSMNINDKKQVNQFIKSMRSLEVQVSVDAQNANGIPRLTHTVDLGGYCDTVPEGFINLDFNTVGCAP